jgi:hypothetical protein
MESLQSDPPMWTAVFAVDRFPAGLAGADVPVLVPLSIAATLDAGRLGAPLHIPGLGIRWEDHVRLQAELDELWSVFSRGASDMPAPVSQYEFGVLHSIRLSTQFIVRRALSDLRPQRVWLPVNRASGDMPIGSRDAMYEWVVHRVLQEETESHSRVQYPSTPSGQRQSSPDATLQDWRRTLISRSKGITRDLLKATSGRRHRQIPITAPGPAGEPADLGNSKRDSHGRSGRRSVLVLAQPGKAKGLLDTRIRGCRMWFLDYQDFEAALSGGGGRALLSADAMDQLGAETGINDYLAMGATRLADRVAWLRSLADLDWDVLITDAQHDPAVRLLARMAIQDQRSAAVIPEGAISYVGELERFGGAALFDENEELTRFVLDRAQRDYWLSRGTRPERIHVSGFLGNTYGPAPAKRILESRRLRRALGRLPLATSKSTVLLSFDAIPTVYELPRFGQPTSNEVWLGLNETLAQLANAGHRVLVKTRDAGLSRELREAYSTQAVLVSDSVPWQVLADEADVIVTRDSSIGWESVARGKPVVVWNFAGYPSFTEVTLRDEANDWMKVARTPSAVPPMVEELLLTQRGPGGWRKDGTAADAPVRGCPEVVATWVEGLVVH